MEKSRLMVSIIAGLLMLFCLPIVFAEQTNTGKHLFLLSGQSNMARFQHKQFFQPAMAEKFGESNIIVLKQAQGGQPISMWYKQWQSSAGVIPEKRGELYDALLAQVKTASQDLSFASITFIWMQGERDAKQGDGELYLSSLQGLLVQLQNDLGRSDINFIVGRLSDYGFKKPKSKQQWQLVRDAQMSFADSYQYGRWIDTDDLNGPSNKLHYEKPVGYQTLGDRYAAAAIELVQAQLQ